MLSYRIKTFGFIFKAEMFNFWRQKLVICDRTEINITDYPPVNDWPSDEKLQDVLYVFHFLIWTRVSLTHYLVSCPYFCPLLPVCLPDAMIRLEEDNRAPPVHSMDTKRHSAERWPPGISPPQIIWWVKSERISCWPMTPSSPRVSWPAA